MVDGRGGSLAVCVWLVLPSLWLCGCDADGDVYARDAGVDPTTSVDAASGGGAKSTDPEQHSASRDAAAGTTSDAAGARAATVDVVLGCGARAPLPVAYVSECTGCHGSGARYPDLRKYTGGEVAFVAKARAGGTEMPKFSATTIDDAALRAAFRVLTTQGGDAGTSAPATSIAPLFSAAAAVPIVFTRDDGVLITRGAGRVRQRHELEGTYGPFGPHYFEHRSYGFVVEDFTVRGESRVRVSYLPIARPEDKTNFRAFKIYGEGNVFHSNMGMKSDTALPSLLLAGVEHATQYPERVAPYARIQSQEVTSNPRAQQRALKAGDVLEFEFGVFIDAAAVRAGSRTSYYTDTFRYRVGQGGLTPENADTSGTLGPRASAWLGGGTTIPYVYAEPETALSQLALNVQHEHVQSFVEGRRLFHTDFGTGQHTEGGNPVFQEQVGKLGPLFVARACASCHPGNGGGQALEGTLDEKSSMVFKLYDSTLGNQLQLREGSAKSESAERTTVTLADGTVVTLSRPRFVLSGAGSTPAFSARVARRLVGLGLLEAVDEQTLLTRADSEDCDGDRISGRAQLVRDTDGSLRVGRFGWKAEKVSLDHQVADALDADLGVQTDRIPGPNGERELSPQDVAKLTTYMRLLGVPGQRAPDDAKVSAGASLFRSVGCAHCHTPELITAAAHPFGELRAQTIQPFSDLLLHDMGEGLADESGSAGTRAAASEWRTAPLWGIAGARDAQGYVALLHDGRAKSALEAVLWHAGEAAHIRERFVALGSVDREALLRFVESL
ncbi:MAG: hypothetical protein RLZZ450_1005 [Pseudomonadota bacterium]|jgi:CxxC motif-containing protein (DUF1111 family)